MNPTTPTRLERWRKKAVGVVVHLVCLTTAWPAWPATTLLQSPPFAGVDPPGNLFVMLDDSGSMSQHFLPRPAGVTIDATVTSPVMIQGDGADAAGALALRAWMIDLDGDWALRAPALNPLWYNPAIRYRPWNRDGTPMPNASIGGATLGTHWGAFTARADGTRLTERDPRQAPTGPGTYASITAGAGRGLLGTDPWQPTWDMFSGRRVTLASPAVDFRYQKMPFDFGPSQSGATGAPRNGHADIAWNAHDPTWSPLDLFSRPLTTGASSTQSGCFTSAAACQSGTPPTPSLSGTVWRRTNCAGVEEVFTADPGPLTCYRARCGTTGAWSAWSPTPVTLSCPYTWTDCNGVTQTSTVNPGPVSCGWRRPDCSGTMVAYGADPGPLTCYRTRACDGSGWGAWSPTNPGTLPACYQRDDCSGTRQYFSGADPGPLSCSYTRSDCSGTNLTFATDPGPLSCWARDRCTGGTDVFTTAPSPATVSCWYERQDCPGTLQQFALAGGDPGNLTCWSRRNCDGTTTGPTATPLAPVTCGAGDGAQTTYSATTITRTSSLLSKTAWSWQNWPWGGPTSSSLLSLVDTTTQTALAPSTVTPTFAAQQNETTTNTASSSTGATCPAGTTMTTCTATPPAGVPDPGALVPARYYVYIGAGSKGDPRNYRVVQIDRTRPSAYLYRVVDATTGANVSASESQRTDCAANGKTHCTWAEEAQNFANWFTYYRNRLFAAQGVMSEAMSGMTSATQQQVRVGYGRIGYFANSVDPWRTELGTTVGALPAIDGFANPGALVRGVRPFQAASPERAQFFDWLFSLAWNGWTPNREAIDSVGRYFSWTDSRGPWGATPGTASAAPQLACRRNFAFLTTDGEWTNVPSGQPIVSPTGPLAGPGTPVEADGVNGPGITGDGRNAGATFVYQPTSWPQFTGGASQSGTLTDVTTYYWNRDLRPDLPNVIRPITDSQRPNPAFWQSMSTYIIGYGLSATMDTQATRDAVRAGTPVAWPTVNLDPWSITDNYRVDDNMRAALASRGEFYAVRDVTTLRSGIVSALNDITATQGSAGGVAVTGAGVTASSMAYFPSYTTGKWTGALRAYPSASLEALAGGTAATPTWSASLPLPAARVVLTSTAVNAPTTFQAATLSAAQQALLTTATTTPAEVVAYVRGDQSLELSMTGLSGGRKFRRRESLLGDFVNSTPLYLKAPDYGFGPMPSIGTSYAAYVSARRASAAATVYIGGNAGTFHAFDAASGVERFAYVPRGVYADLPALTDPGYGHRYFVDGPVTAGDWHDGSSWRSIVVGTTGAGGAASTGGGSIFAIDVTNPAAVGASSVKWDLTKAESPHLGHVLSRGIVGRVKTGASTYRWVYVTGNGYESASNQAALLVIDIATGALTAIPAGPAWNAALGLNARNGLGGVTVAYDAQRNISAVYGGDRQGNLWRFDFSAGVPTQPRGFDGAATPLFTAVDGAGRRRPITAAPRLALHPRGGLYVIFGTGKLHDDGDVSNADPQAIYGLWEKPGLATQIAGTSLVSVPMTTAPGTGARSFSLTGIDWNTKLGWMVTLTGGERVISDPSADLGTMSISSFNPAGNTDPCEGGGTSYIYRIDYASGQATGALSTGVVGAITPLVSLPGTSRTQSSLDVRDVLRRVPGSGTGGDNVSNATCRLYSTSIQGRPNVIAQNCPGLAPMRVWRQPTR